MVYNQVLQLRAMIEIDDHADAGDLDESRERIRLIYGR